MDANVREFLTEAEEISTKIFDALLRLESGQTADPAIVDALYREVHTLKGLAQLFSVAKVAGIAEKMELTLEKARQDLSLINEAFLEEQMSHIGDVAKYMADLKAGAAPLQIAAPKIEADDWTMQKLAALPDPAPVAAPVAAAPTPAPTPAPAPAPAPVAVAPVPTAPAAPAANEGSTAPDTVRVSVALLDKLMLLVGEMVLVRNQVLQYAAKQDDFEFLNLSQQLDQVTSEVQGEVMKTRMQPIGNVLTRFQRVVRDLAKDLGKKLELELSGVETEIDKALLEAIKDPLMHIVRNSCDHGVEDPAERKRVGKPETGKIRVHAYHEGGQVIVRINDDGRGLNREKLINKALEKNILTPERAKGLTDREAYALIFAPGFSTAAQVTSVSGRGVGMDVVKSNIEKIGGLVDLDSELGRGMTLFLKIPLTLAIVPAMIVRGGKSRFAIPQAKLVELLRIERAELGARIENLHGKSFYRLRGKLLPLVALNDVLGRSPETAEATDAFSIVVLQSDATTFGLIVDEVQDTADIVVKPLSSFLKSLGVYSGATVLGDGSVALILDVAGMALRHQLAQPAHEVRTPDTTVDLSELQEFLLFRIGTSGIRYGLPLTLVHRLEEFAPERIELSGGQRVVRYRDSILPILDINGIVNAAREEVPARAVVPVIVIRKSERLFGIEVTEILDVLATTDAMDDSSSDRPSILGNLITGAGVVVVTDVLRIIDDLIQNATGHGPVATGQPGAPAPTTLTAVRGTGRILFAEDTNFFRKHVVNVLEKAGYTVTTARDGREAAELLEKSPVGTFDALLSDIEMPNMNGFELVEFLRGHQTWGHLPAVALTTRVTPEHVERGLKAGFTRYLEKMNADILLAELNTVLTAPSTGVNPKQVA